MLHGNFLKSVIIHQSKPCLRYLFSVCSVVFLSIEKVYQTLETVFYIFYRSKRKHLEIRQKYYATRRILNSLLSVWISR